MEKIEIQFSKPDDVSEFVNVVSKYDGDFDLYCGSYCVDAKSLLGIMTMDWRNKMWMTGNITPQDRIKLVNELGAVVAA